MILHRQLEVGKGNCDASSHDEKDDGDKEQDAKELIGAVAPHARIDVEQFNVDGTKK